MVQTRASHTTHQKRSSTGHRLGIIPSKHAFAEWVGFDGSGSSCSRVAEGSSGTHVSEEVVVFVREAVVVHGDRGT